MTQQFHDEMFGAWRKAKIVSAMCNKDDPETRPMTRDEARDYKADLAQAHDEALQAEGKP